MNESSLPAYGLWPIVIISSAVMIIFAFSFSHPQTKRDWRTFGAFSAFLVAMYTEMYGFPMTIYILSGWLIKRYPNIDLFTHANGHLWNTILGLEGDTHFNELHIISELLIGAGFILLATAWKVLYRALSSHQIANSGPYAYIRHPQYVGFILIMVGLLLQWPTIPTLIMFPILVIMYIRLARREECEAIATFGEIYSQYSRKTPAYFPKFNLEPKESDPSERDG